MWNSNATVWSNHLAAYPAAIKTRERTENKSDLVSLDAFVWSELPSKVESRSRKPPHITSEEYARLVRWKLKRGKWRPRLQGYADAIDNTQVVNVSTEAFAALKKGKVKEAVKLLVSLKGCGPATASAILAAVDKDVPFMSDELLQEAMGERKYTVSAYIQLVAKVEKKAQQLSEADSAHAWTARDIEHALFAAHHPTEEDPADFVERPSYASQAKAAKAKDEVAKTTKSGKQARQDALAEVKAPRTRPRTVENARSRPSKRKRDETTETPQKALAKVKAPRTRTRTAQNTQSRPLKRKRDGASETKAMSNMVTRRTRSSNALEEDKAGVPSIGLRRSTRSRTRNGG